MPLTRKQKAESAELINQALFNIPVNNPEDFVLIADALQDILKPGTGKSIADELKELKDSISDVAEFLDSDFMYVPLADFPEFQKLIEERITTTINEFKTMMDWQKHKYISEQKLKQSTTQAADMKMKNITESKAWTEKQQTYSTGPAETLEQELERRTREFQMEGVPPEFFPFQFSQGITGRPGEILVTAAELSALPAAIQVELIQNERQAAELLSSGLISLSQLVAMNPAVRTEFLHTSTADVLSLLGFLNIFLPEIVQMSPTERSALLQKAMTALMLVREIRSEGPPDQAIINELFTYGSEIKLFLAAANIGLPEFLQTTPAIRAELIQHVPSVTTLTNNHGNQNISLQELVKLNNTDRSILLSNPDSPKSAAIIANIKKPQEFQVETGMPAVRFHIIRPQSDSAPLEQILNSRGQVVVTNEELKAMAISEPIRQELIRNQHAVSYLIQNQKLPLEMLTLTSASDQAFRTGMIEMATINLLKHDYQDAVSQLNNANISEDQLLEMDPVVRTELIEYAPAVTTLIKDQNIALQQLIQLESAARNTLLSNPDSQESATIITRIKAETPQGEPPRQKPGR